MITEHNTSISSLIHSPAATPPLTSRWHCVLKHLIKLAEVHDHREFVWLHHRGHLLASHARRDAKFPLGHVKTQLVVLLLISFVQRVEVTAGRRKEKEEGGMRWERTGEVNAMPKIRSGN